MASEYNWINFSNLSIEKSSDNSNSVNFYRQLLILAKRGDREQFLDIFRQILTMEKKINIFNRYENSFNHLIYLI